MHYGNADRTRRRAKNDETTNRATADQSPGGRQTRHDSGPAQSGSRAGGAPHADPARRGNGGRCDGTPSRSRELDLGAVMILRHTPSSEVLAVVGVEVVAR